MNAEKQPSKHPDAIRDFTWIRPFCLHVILPIAIGAAIYLLFRTTSLLVFDWVAKAHLSEVTFAARQLLSGIHLPEWLLYTLPDGLWVYAVTSWMILIWKGNPPFHWLFVGLALAVGGEIGQAIAIVPGTYQHLDILFYVTGFLLACLQLELKHETSLLFHIGIASYDRIRFWKR